MRQQTLAELLEQKNQDFRAKQVAGGLAILVFASILSILFI